MQQLISVIAEIIPFSNKRNRNFLLPFAQSANGIRFNGDGEALLEFLFVVY